MQPIGPTPEQTGTGNGHSARRNLLRRLPDWAQRWIDSVIDGHRSKQNEVGIVDHSTDFKIKPSLMTDYVDRPGPEDRRRIAGMDANARISGYPEAEAKESKRTYGSMEWVETMDPTGGAKEPGWNPQPRTPEEVLNYLDAAIKNAQMDHERISETASKLEAQLSETQSLLQSLTRSIEALETTRQTLEKLTSGEEKGADPFEEGVRWETGHSSR